jgi:hypothetical protein
MTQAAPKSIVLHLAGLALAILLAAACWGVYAYTPDLVRGTFFQRIENIVMFAAVVALLTLAERIWIIATSGFHAHPPE